MRRGELKKGGYFLRGDNRGASLIAVIVALVFVVTMGLIIMETTVTNILMREVELSEKVNFYNADAVMNDLKREMAELAAVKMQDAYTEMLSRYGAFEEGEEELQEEFRQIYVDNLAEYFQGVQAGETLTFDNVVKETIDGKESVVFGDGKYDSDQVKDLVLEISSDFMEDTSNSDENRKVFKYNDNTVTLNIAADNAVFTTDYKKGLFTLKNLRIEFLDGHDHETWISTDLVFDTPAFQFDDGTSKSFMNYALIADSKIEVARSNDSTVNGSVYAGAGGIVSASEGTVGEGTLPAPLAKARFYGENIVTRGDIVVNNSTTLAFGDSSSGTTHIWAQNIRTEGESKLDDDVMNLEMNGEINIEDDLTLNGAYSKVELSGSYNGYHFRENYSKEDPGGSGVNTAPAADSKFSSAIMINGKQCTLDFSGLDHLFIAGRTFISRGKNLSTNNNKDVLLGESLSVRADQLAYLVSDRYLEKDEVSGEVVLDSSGYAKLSKDGRAKYLKFTETGKDLEHYAISEDIMVAPYYYRNNVLDVTNSKLATRYYLYFKSGKIANEFFSAYWDENKKLAEGGDAGNGLADYGKEYAYAILLNDDTALTLSGELLQRELTNRKNLSVVEDDEIELRHVEITAYGDVIGWEKPDSIYWERSDMLARTYKSLQDDLAGVYTRVDSGDVRFYDEFANLDKKQDSLFANLIDVGELAKMTDSEAIQNMIDDPDVDAEVIADGVKITGSGWEIILCRNNGENGTASTYTIPNGFKGIVIATGDVQINSDVTGTVISGGTITLYGSDVKVNKNMPEDADLVKSIFNEVKEKPYGSQFAAIFKDYQPSDMADMSSERIGDYLFYENWMKNEE